jgi:cobyrinic acid a,c-diamide synthase
MNLKCNFLIRFHRSTLDSTPPKLDAIKRSQEKKEDEARSSDGGLNDLISCTYAHIHASVSC